MIKVDKRSRLSNKSLDVLLLLNSAKIPVADFHLDPSIDYGGQPSPGDPLRKRERSTDHVVAINLDHQLQMTWRKVNSESEEDRLECWNELIEIEINSDSYKLF